MSVVLTEALLSQAAGWEVMKRARAYVEQGEVLSSYWAPPLLRGVVQAGELTIRASMVIKSQVDIENLCTCRDAREWGKICAHGVAVGIHFIKGQQGAATSAAIPRTTTAKSIPARNVSSIVRSSNGEPAALHIIFPPNLEQAIERGKIMLVIEASWSAGRVPLNALPKTHEYAFSESDSAIVDQIESLANGETPAVLQLEPKAFGELLPLLANHTNLTLGKSTPLTVSKTPYSPLIKATLEPKGEILLELKSKTAVPKIIQDWVWQNGSFQPMALPPQAAELYRGPVRIARLQIPEFLSQHWPRLASGGAEANFRLEDFALEPQAPKFHLELKGGLAQLAALLQCAYGSRIMTVGVTGADENVWLPDPENPRRYSTRDSSAEHAALARLQRSGFTGPDSQGKLLLNGQTSVLNFFAREYPKLQREWTVTLEERLQRSTQQNMERVEPHFHISSGVQWFDLGVVFEGGGQTFSAPEIQRLLLSGQSHAKLKNGKFAIIDTDAVEELQEVLLDCSPTQQGGGYRINNNQSGFLEATLKQHKDWQIEAPSAWHQRAAHQSGETKLECPPLENLEATLRPYQKDGVAWLRFLRENQFGGILADEMGLGKTLQTLAFLRWVRHSRPGLAPMLIVCPTSLVFNWLAEIQKFTPELKALALHGTGRHQHFAEISSADLVITSYALIRRDAEKYRPLQFDTVVLDEAQHIKNRQTQNAQAVKSIRSTHHLVLTGTPLENSVQDLWSIFDFLMPGYLGSAKDFRERYELPILRDKNNEAQSRLARRLRPFLLRRLKKDVAADLPAKLEQVAYCELTAEQRELYQTVIEASRQEILAAEGEQGQAKSRMVMLNALLRLRQICCDLRLLKLEQKHPSDPSAKLDLFGELLEEVLDGGHRVLVFSQFVSMLALLKERLEAEQIEYCYLDGSTTDRAAVVQKFQTDNCIPVFLISLKAGGVGLNLTGADTVIHFDPWWNPAVEDQATDRAHRIGQTNVVTSYKLIARDTVEEKILTLQNRKREIIKATLEGEEEFTGSLTWKELQELLM